MRNSEIFVLAAKLVAITGIDYKNHPDIRPHERDAIENGFRELNFFQPDFVKKYETDKPVAAGAVGKPPRQTKGV
jgi:hypothetical protein